MVKRIFVLGCFCLLAVFAFIDRPAFSQGGKGGGAGKKGGFGGTMQRAKVSEKRQLAAPWVGVTTNGSPLSGLFSIAPRRGIDRADAGGRAGVSGKPRR